MQKSTRRIGTRIIKWVLSPIFLFEKIVNLVKQLFQDSSTTGNGGECATSRMTKRSVVAFIEASYVLQSLWRSRNSLARVCLAIV